MLNVFLWLANITTSDVRTYGLDTSNVLEEKVPYVLETGKRHKLKRQRVLCQAGVSRHTTSNYSNSASGFRRSYDPEAGFAFFHYIYNSIATAE
ncbi:MAG: hypothetical protein U0Z17_08260 [Bacteroidales bacterium]